MRKLFFFVCAMFLFSNAFAQFPNHLPTSFTDAKLVGHWEFNDGDAPFKATKGEALTPVNLAETDWVEVDGKGTLRLDNPASKSENRALSLVHGIAANGGSEENVNNYAIVFDLKVDAERGEGVNLLSLFRPGSSGDGRAFIGFDTKRIGLTSYKKDAVLLGDWNRVILNINLEAAKYDMYVIHPDGTVILHETSNQSGVALSINNPIQFFGDDDGENGRVNVSRIALFNDYLTAAELAGLGVRTNLEGAPELSSEGDDKWYYIKSARGEGFYTDNGEGRLLDCLPAIEGLDGQLWKLEGKYTYNARLVSKLGNSIDFANPVSTDLIPENTAAHFMSSTFQGTFEIQESSFAFAGHETDKVLRIKNHTTASNIDKKNNTTGFATWSAQDEGTSVVFLLPENVTTIPNPLSTGEFDEKWYTIQFNRALPKVFQENESGQISQVEMDAEGPVATQLWKFVGTSLDDLKIVSYNGYAFSMEGDDASKRTVGVAVGNGDRYKLEQYKGMWRIKNYKAGNGSRYYLNDESKSFVTQYTLTDAGAPLILTQVTELPAYLGTDQPTLAFGQESVGKTATLPLMIKGRGLTEDLSYVLEDGFETVFVITEAEGWDIVNGGYLNITFSPEAEQDYSATLTVKSGEKELIITLTGNGVNTPTLAVTPETLDFEAVTLNKKAPYKVVTASGMLLTGDITFELGGDDKDAFEVVEKEWTAAEGGTLNVSVRPTEIRSYSATLIIKTEGGEDKIVTLTAEGEDTQLPVLLSTESEENWYYIFTDRGKAYMQGFGINKTVASRVSQEGEDGQLWKFVATDFSKKYKIVNKKGGELAYAATTIEDTAIGNDRFYLADESGFTFRFGTTGGGDALVCNEIGDGSFIDKANGNWEYGQYVHGGAGGVLKFIPEAEMTEFLFPKVSDDENEYWYQIQFSRNTDAPNGLVIAHKGLDNKLTTVDKDDDALDQLWKVTGTDQNYTITSYSGAEIKLVDSRFVLVAEGGDKFGILPVYGNSAYLGESMAIKRTATAANNGFNAFGGSRIGVEIGEYSVTDDGSALTFVPVSPIALSDDATLKSLSVTGFTLDPEFSAGQLEYTLCAEDATSIEVVAEANDAKASVEGAGTKDLVDGENRIVITVTAENGDTKEYVLLVTKWNVGLDNLAGTEVTVVVQNGQLTAKFTGTKDVALYTATGVVLDKVSAASGPYVKSLPAGVYILTVDGVSYKRVVVK